MLSVVRCRLTRPNAKVLTALPVSPVVSTERPVPGKVGDLILAKASVSEDCPPLLVHLSSQVRVRGGEGALLHLGKERGAPFQGQLVEGEVVVAVV